MSDESHASSKHAEELRIIRVVQRATGQSIQNIRTALRAQERSRDFAKIQLPQIPPQVKPKPQIETQTTTLPTVRPKPTAVPVDPDQDPKNVGTLRTFLTNMGGIVKNVQYYTGEVTDP